MEYNFREIEQKWQQFWKDNSIYHVTENESKPKFYVLDMFPYPSGAGLHVGHPLGYIASDIYSRYKRLQGFNVLHPMGFDAYGLPAEQYAIQTGQHPATTTKINISRYKEQLDKIGFCYDWDREVRTCEPNYYKWTQWAFIQMFNHYYDKDLSKAIAIESLVRAFEANGTEDIQAACTEDLSFTAVEWNAKTEKEQQEILLNYRIAYLADLSVNWCPKLGTVLANDEVSEGLSVRGGFPVEQRVMRQWSLRVSAYAQRLLDGLTTVDWSDSLKETQKNWIGRSEGAEMVFRLSPSPSPQERGVNTTQYENIRKPWQTTDAERWNLLIDIAKNFRSNQTKAEDALWQKVRAKKIGFKIRRQHIVDRFIADFICLEKGVIIEVDGGIHDSAEQKEKDALRTEILNENGFDVIRFSNEEILTDIGSVIDQIIEYLDDAPDFAPSRSQDFTVENGIASKHSIPFSIGEGQGERSLEVPSLGGDLGEVSIFTTRADTIFGVTFMVLAPESELVQQLTTVDQKADVDAYLDATKKRTERERIADKKISGVFTGSYAINPLTNEPIPVWISDYVLAGYGTGAIMAVPAHDSRDYAFAKHFDLPIIPLIEGCDVSEESFDAKEGILMNSGFLNGLTVKEAIAKTKEYISEKEIGKVKTNFRLRDAIFSRQRYWGEPFPVYYKEGLPYMLDESKLPLELPEIDKYLPTEDGQPPLGRAKGWTYTPPQTLPQGEGVSPDSSLRKYSSPSSPPLEGIEGRSYPLEFNTMPGFAGSSAYYLRYMDPKNETALVSPENNQYWRNVDLYIGGTEHATGHLIYSRFWNKFLYDLGIVCEEEPFKKLVNQGMIQGRSNFVYRVKDSNTFVSYNLRNQYETTQLHVDVNIVSNDFLDLDAFKNWLPEYNTAEFILEDGKYVCGWAVEKMSKSMYNVVNPDVIVEKYGADTLRFYEMFLGPLEQSKPWDTNGIDGVHRFLKKLWGLFYKNDSLLVTDSEPTKEELKSIHKLIKKVSGDIETFSFNTSVSAFMICVNELTTAKCSKKAILKDLAVLLAPFAPHIAEELWHTLGETITVCDAQWPTLNEEYLKEDVVTYAITFNGKVRFSLEFAAETSKEEVEKVALAHENSQKYLEGKTPKKIIVVPGKLVNIVV